VEEETTRLSRHAGEQHAAGDPFEFVGETGTRQVEQVDECKSEEDARLCVPGSEEALLPVGQALTAGEEGEQRQPPYSTVTSKSTATMGRIVVASMISPFDRSILGRMHCQ
jgi:hypothetical protein